jgi:hypothetical protein
MFIRFFFLVIGVCAIISTAQAETVFFETLPDVPVAPGLEVLPAEVVSFDKPDGRIVEVVAVLSANGQHVGTPAIRQYYDSILPSFGWVMTGDQTYVRGRERLRFWFESVDGQVNLHVLVEPARQ